MAETTEEAVVSAHVLAMKARGFASWLAAGNAEDVRPEPDDYAELASALMSLTRHIATLIAERDRLLAALDAMRAERDEVARLREALGEVVRLNQAREWTGDPLDGGVGWIVRDGKYAKLARAALATQEKPQGIPAGKEG